MRGPSRSKLIRYLVDKKFKYVKDDQILVQSLRVKVDQASQS